MNDETKRLRALPARTPEQILSTLASAAAEENKRGGNIPLVTLSLTNGRDISGFIVGLVEQRGFSAVVLQTGSTGRHDLGSDATYINVHAVTAVTVHGAGAIAEMLAGGELQVNDPPPTRLATRRSVLEDAARVSTALGVQIVYRVDVDAAGDGEPMRSLAEASRRTSNVLVAVAGDAMGKQALAQVREVAIEVGGIPNARRNGGTLLVTADHRVDPAELLKVIEAAI